MILLNKTMLIWSLSIVWGIYCSSFLHGAEATHAAKPMFYVNFFDDEVIYESTGNPSIEENEISSFSDEKNKNQNYEEVNALNAHPTDISETPSPSNSKYTEDLVSDGLKRSDMYESQSSVRVGTGMSTERSDRDLAETSDNIFMQFTRIYFKAIATLIQHIMDALFCVPNNEPTNSELSEAPNLEMNHLESSPSRKKRDLLKPESVPNNTADSVGATVQPNASEDNSAEKALGAKLESSEEGANLSKPNLDNISQQDNHTVNASDTSLKSELQKLLKTPEGEINTEHITEENKHETTLNTKYETTKLKSEIKSLDVSTSSDQTHKPSVTKKSITDRPHHKVHGAPTDYKDTEANTVSDEGIGKDHPPLLLYDQTSDDRQESRIVYNVEQPDFKPKLTEHSNHENDDLNAASSTTASIVLKATGTVLGVIVLVSVAVAVVYVFVWKKSTTQTPRGVQMSSQRSTMA